MRKYIFRLSIVFGVIAFGSVTYLTIKFNQAEKMVSSSMSQPWPNHFKSSFIQGCHEQIKNQPYASRSIASIKLRTNAKKYCQCLAQEIEKNKVIATEYNEIKESEEDYIQRTGIQIDRFLFSQSGRATIHQCKRISQSN